MLLFDDVELRSKSLGHKISFDSKHYWTALENTLRYTMSIYK